MVSLSTFSKVTEEGVLFSSPFNGEQTMLSPEESMRIQVIITYTASWVIDHKSKFNTAFYRRRHHHAARRCCIFTNNGASRGRSDVCAFRLSRFHSQLLIYVNIPTLIDSRWRSVRWMDRCIEVHKSSGKSHKQNLFAIVQGGLDTELRDKCLDAMILRKDDIPGYAVGGLSGGEEKGVFWRM